MPNEFIKINTDANFFKDFEIETPAETIESQETAIEKLKKEQEESETAVKSLEDLKKELEEVEKEEESPKETKEKKEEKKEEETEVKKEDEVEYSFKPFIEIMAETGVLDLPENAEIGDSAEDLVEAFETTVNKRISQGIEEYKESVPELAKSFLEYLENGGDPKRFIEAQTGPIDLTNIDITDEANQKMLIREHLKSQDYTNEEIKEILQDYEDSLLLEKQAKVAVKKLEAIQSKQTEILLKQQEAEVREREKALKEYVSDIQRIIKESKEIAGLEIPEAEKKTFENYLFKRDKAGLTAYQKDLQENPNKTQVELAYLKFKKYDFAKAAKKGENAAARKIRETVLSKTETTVKGSTADVPRNSSDFSAFEKMFKNMQKQV